MNKIITGLLLVGFLLGGFLLPATPTMAMSGSGTESDPYIISDVNDLQDMNLDYSAYYELGGNIDASATSSWNGGAGFDPVGETGNSVTRRPTDDYSSTGHWIIYPSGTTRWDKVDEATPDDSSTYIVGWTSGCRTLFSFSAIDLPVDAIHISVVVYARMTNVSNLQVKPSLRVGGSTYDLTSGYKVYGPGWATHGVVIGTNPKTGLDWTINDIEGVGGNTLDAFGVYFTTATGSVTQVYIRVLYGLAFCGSFDGKGYTIDDLFINRPTEDRVGLFGDTEAATIQDVRLTDADITGDDYVGVLIGECFETTIQDIELTGIDVTGDGGVGGLIGMLSAGEVSSCSSTGTVVGSSDHTGGLLGYAIGPVGDSSSSCTVSGDYQVGGLIGGQYHYSTTILTIVERCHATGDVSGDYGIGGLVGWIDSGIIDYCYATGGVSSTSSNAGGLVGLAGWNGVANTESKISHSYATGKVTTTGGWDIGGLIGHAQGPYWGGQTLTIEQCYSTGQVSGGSGSGAMGGFVGWVETDALIKDCYTRSDVVGDDDIGGFVGLIYDTATIDNCYSTGLVMGATYLGGFSSTDPGQTDPVTVTNCFWDTQTSGQSTSKYGTGLTTAQMKTKTTYLDAGWDFEDVWKMGGPASGGWAAFWLTSIVFLLFAGIMFGATKNPGLSILMAFPLVIVAAWLGVGTTMLQFVLVVVLVVAVIFGIYFVLGRFA